MSQAPGPADHFKEALEHLARGDDAGARRAIDRAVELLSSTFGEESRELAQGQNQRGMILAEMGDFEGARSAFEHALGATQLEDEERLDFQLNLGTALTRLGRHEEGGALLSENADQRRDRFGLDDVRYALGLTALAEAENRRGEHPSALDHVGEAVGIFWEAKDARIASALALEADILTATESDTPPFAELGELPDRTIEEIAAATLARCREAQAQPALRLLKALRGLLVERLGESHGATIRVLAGIANTERELGNNAGRREALDALIASFDCLGALPEMVETMLQRALAELEAGEETTALETQKAALAMAEEQRNDRMVAKCLRFHGLLLLDGKQQEAAKAALERAIEVAERSKDPDQIARSQATLGVALVHLGMLDAARPVLEQSMIQLAPDDHDMDWAEEHLRAAQGVSGAPQPILGHLRDAYARIRAPK